MGLLNLSLPTIGQPDATEDVKIVNALSTIQTAMNGNIDGANAPSIAGAYRTLWRQTNLVLAGTAGGLYVPDAAGGQVAASGVGRLAVHLDPADFTISNVTTKYRLKVTMFTNGVSPGVTFTFGLNPISSVGGATTVQEVVNATPVTGSTVAHSFIPINSGLIDVTSDFVAPAAGFYTFTINLSGATAANSQAAIEWCLQVRNN